MGGTPEEDYLSFNEPPGSDVLPPFEQREGENAKQERLAQEQAQQQDQGQDQNQGQDQDQGQDQWPQGSEQNDRDTESSGG